MEKVKLVVANGELVGTFEIPSFNPQYEVLMWGIRTFRLHPTEKNTYVEAPAYAIVTQPLEA
jgi:hypothetical protein